MKPKTNAMLMMVLLPLGLLLVLWGLRPLPLQAATITVCVSGCDHDTIKDAVDEAVPGDFISVQAGSYIANVVITESLTIQGAGAADTFINGDSASGESVFVISGTVAVTITNLTIQNGSASTSLFLGGLGGGIYVNENASLLLDTVTVKDNSAEAAGGGIANNGTLLVQNSAITGNTGPEGGGIYSTGPVTLTSVLISQNEADDIGGGISTLGSLVTLVISGSTIVENTALADGGGIAVIDAPDVQIVQTAVQTNTVSDTGRGGGLYNSDSNVIIDGSTFSGNEAGAGAAIFNEKQNDLDNDTHLLVTGSTIRDNAAIGSLSADGGGGIYNINVMTLTQSLVAGNRTTQNDVIGAGVFNAPEGRFAIENSTIAGNQATRGSGIFNTGQMTLTSVTLYGNVGIDPGVSVYMTPTLAIGLGETITPTLVAINTAVADAVGASNCSGATAWTSLGYNVASDTSCGLTGPEDRQGIAVRLQPLADNGGPTQTSAPALNSPLIDSGSPDSADCPAVDQRGVARPVGDRCDVGAYETTVYQLYLPAILR